MRADLLDPVKDQTKYRCLLPLAVDVLSRHEAGLDYADGLHQLSKVAGVVVSQANILAAFGSGDAESLARQLAIDWHTLPKDLTQPEMLELLESICAARGHQVHQEYWIRCLEVNTGDAAISDLIFWPESYFGSSYDGRELEPAEMLVVALSKRAAL